MNTLELIQSQAQRQDDAIKSHPPLTYNTHRLGRDSFFEGFNESKEKISRDFSPLTLDEIYWMYRLFLSSAFISGWYGLYGDKQKQNLLMNETLTILHGLYPNPEFLFQEYLKYEHMSQMLMREEGIKPGSSNSIGIIIFLIIIGYILYLLFN